MKISCLVLSLILAGSLASYARLGENEAQSKARYGEPNPALISGLDKPLIPGATECVYAYQGWRVRVAFVNGVTHRIEYVKALQDGGLKEISESDLQALLDAEKDKYKWREDKPRTGYPILNELKTAFGARRWERSDHADATLIGKIMLVVQSRDVERLEKQLAKSPRAAATPVPVPKF